MKDADNLHGSDGQDLTQGPILRQLWSLAWPMMVSVFFYTLYNLVDAYWVSKLSAEAIAAVSISQITLFVMISLGFGITVGSGVIMAMHIGAKNKVEAERVLGQSFLLSTIMGAFFTAIALIFSDRLLTLSGASGAIFEPAKEYFVIFSGGSVLLFVMMSVMFAFNSQGDTNTLTKLFALSTGINLVLDPLFIFGKLGFPQMGISGAATATIISMFVFMVVAIRVLSDKKRHIRFRFRNLTLQWASVKKVLNIGFPAALTQVIFPVGLAALTYIASLGFAEPGAIAFALGFRLEFFAFLPAVGFGFGAMAMIGQNIGAGKIARAKKALKKALQYGFLGAAGFGVVVAALSAVVIRIFTDDPVVTQYARQYLLTVALFSYGFLASLMVEANAFQAIGHSWPGFWLFLLRVGVITLPLASIFTFVLGLPIAAIWLSIIAGNVISSLVGYVWISKKFSHLELKEVPVHT